MDAAQLTSLIASIASLILSVVAIFLSITFYKWSSELSESSREAAKSIASGVEKLEILFNKLYEGTFSMMRDTVSDMRRQLWPDLDSEPAEIAAEVEKLAEERFTALKEELGGELSRLLSRQEIADASLAAVQQGVSELFDKAIEESRRVEEQAHGMRSQDMILEILQATTSGMRRRTLPVPILRETWIGVYGPLAFAFDTELLTMEQRGLVELSTPGAITPETEIRLLGRSLKGH